MTTFKKWLENNQGQLTGPQDLPPIPNDMVRLTNFTNPTVGPKLLAGEPFKFARGMIDSTTDSFSNNKDIWDLLTTGKTGAWDRNSFGDQVVLLDVPNEEHRQYRNAATGLSEVDNSRVLGIFDKETQTLTRNSNYNPMKPIDLQILQNNLGVRRAIQNTPRTPSPSDTPSDVDVW